MYAASKPSKIKISRVEFRYRHLAQDVPSREQIAGKRRVAPGEKEEETVVPEKEETDMGRAHRMFHRRAAEPSTGDILTGGGEVVATVDGNANTALPAGTDPAVPATIALPSVPAVPPFPTDLVVPPVPAFPFPSGVPSLTLSPTLTPTDAASQPPAATTDVADLTPAFPTLIASGIGYNSTTSSTTSSSSSTSSSLSLSSTRSSSSQTTTSSSSRSSTSSTQSSTSSTRSSSSGSSTITSSSSISQTTWTSSATSTSPPEFYGGGAGDPANGVPGSGEGSPANTNAVDADEPITTPRIVGSVIGSLAGTALLLWLILFLIKRHKRKGSLQLARGDTADHQPIASSGQQMASRNSFVPTGVPSFLNRFSGASRSTIDSSTGETGFQRISGRKLPSAFSEGMTSEQFARGQGTLSGSSFYTDDQGFYGGAGVAPNKEFGKETGGPSGYGTIGSKERFMPSPARTPVVRHPDDAPTWGTSRNGGSAHSPPHSPNPDLPLKPTLGRSHPSHDGSRSSRFTENV